jgi:hypothetical protein
MGESRSPCRRPRAWQILFPSVPLSKTFVLAIDSKADTQSCHACVKPMCWRISIKNDQVTELNAWARLTFSSRLGLLLACKSLAVD